jgi:hypothetical protein
VTDVKIDFYDGKQHPVDSKDIAFQIAGKEAFKEAFMNARPCLLEPIHLVEIKVPEDAMGNVIGDLSSRRGKILGMDAAGGYPDYQSARASHGALSVFYRASIPHRRPRSPHRGVRPLRGNAKGNRAKDYCRKQKSQRRATIKPSDCQIFCFRPSTA